MVVGLLLTKLNQYFNNSVGQFFFFFWPSKVTSQIGDTAPLRHPLRKVFFVFRAVFSDENGLTCAVKLDDLPVHFSDLFIPLRVPAQFEVDIFLFSIFLQNTK